MTENEFINQFNSELDSLIDNLILEIKSKNIKSEINFYSLVNEHINKIKNESENIYENIVKENNINLDDKIIDASNYTYLTKGLYLNKIRLSILSNKHKDYNDKAKGLFKSLGLQDY